MIWLFIVGIASSCFGLGSMFGRATSRQHLNSDEAKAIAEHAWNSAKNNCFHVGDGCCTISAYEVKFPEYWRQHRDYL